MSHHVLVVDDESDITALVAYHLAKSGYRVVTAHSGPDALRAAQDVRPDLVVLDLMLPGMSGFDLARRLADSHPHVPIVFMTGYTDERAVPPGYELEESRLIRKPFKPRELVDRLLSFLSSEGGVRRSSD